MSQSPYLVIKPLDLATIVNFKFLLSSHFSQPLPWLILNHASPELFQLPLSSSLCSTLLAPLIQFLHFLMSDLTAKQNPVTTLKLKNILIGSPLSIALSLNFLTWNLKSVSIQLNLSVTSLNIIFTLSFVHCQLLNTLCIPLIPCLCYFLCLNATFCLTFFFPIHQGTIKMLFTLFCSSVLFLGFFSLGRIM